MTYFEKKKKTSHVYFFSPTVIAWISSRKEDAEDMQILLSLLTRELSAMSDVFDLERRLYRRQGKQNTSLEEDIHKRNFPVTPALATADRDLRFM